MDAVRCPMYRGIRDCLAKPGPSVTFTFGAAAEGGKGVCDGAVVGVAASAAGRTGAVLRVEVMTAGRDTAPLGRLTIETLRGAVREEAALTGILRDGRTGTRWGETTRGGGSEGPVRTRARATGWMADAETVRCLIGKGAARAAT